MIVELYAYLLAMLGVGFGVSFWCYETYPDPAWWEGSVVGLVVYIAIGARWLYVLFAGLR